MHKNHKVFLIVAVDRELGIGKNGKLPWHFRNEMKHFAKTTTKVLDNLKSLKANTPKQNAVIMGRTTWESLPKKYRPLPGRLNIVLTRNSNYQVNGAQIASSFESALEILDNLENENNEKIEKIFIIGGSLVFEESLNNPEILEKIDGIYLTKINKNYHCDTFFPDPSAKFPNKKLMKTEKESEVDLEYLLLEK